MMRKHLRATGPLLALAVLLFTNQANAALTRILPGHPGEQGLASTGGFLDTYFGLDNLARVDDDMDRYWGNEGTVEITTLGKWADFKQSFGYIDADDNFTSLINVASSHSRPSAQFNADESGSVFRFGLDPSGAPLWSSDPADNDDLIDHMVTWRVNGVDNKSRSASYVISWEDLHGGGDRDFNDLVLLVSGDIIGGQVSAVPVPAAFWLFGSGMFGLATVARRKTR